MYNAGAQFCDTDCQSFRRLLISDWPKEKPKAAILFLFSEKKLEQLYRSMSLLAQHFNNEFHYPIILFTYDLQLTRGKKKDNLLSQLRGANGTMMIFVQYVEFKLPSFIREGELEQEVKFQQFNINYRHMCQFYSLQVRYIRNLQDDQQALSS